MKSRIHRRANTHKHKLPLLHEIKIPDLAKSAILEKSLTDSRNAERRLPEAISELELLLKTIHPLSLLSIFSFYSNQATVDQQGRRKSFSINTSQHHVELLHAIILRIPIREWGKLPPLPSHMQNIFDILSEVAECFSISRMHKLGSIDGTALKSLLMQEKIRIHTQAVRNWGYFEHVLDISKGLLSPLDDRLQAVAGFAATDIVDIGRTLIATLEDRSRAHIASLKKIFQGPKKIDALLQRYYKEYPALSGSPQLLRSALPHDISYDAARIIIMSHLDLSHMEHMTFSADEIGKILGKNNTTIERALNAIALKPTELETYKIEYFFLSNPIWKKPAIALPNGYFVPAPQIILSHIHQIIHNIFEDHNLSGEFSDQRSKFLEQRTKSLFVSKFPTARVMSSIKWRNNDVEFETDLFVELDSVIFICESKSHRIPESALRGAPDRLKRVIEDIVVHPSEQSSRLEREILSAKRGRADSVSTVKPFKIDPSRVSKIIRISVTLEDFSILSSSEGELKEIGWIPRDHSLAPVIGLADLECIFHILDNVIELSDYLKRREYFQKSSYLLGDELDFLGTYLTTGFPIASDLTSPPRLALIGMSDPIDSYYQGREVGLVLPKPRSRISQLYRTIITHLAVHSPPGWMAIGLELLASANHQSQKSIERHLEKLKINVLRKYKVRGHNCALFFMSESNEDVLIGFYVFVSENNNFKLEMEEILKTKIKENNKKSGVIFGKDARKWNKPFVALMALGIF